MKKAIYSIIIFFSFIIFVGKDNISYAQSDVSDKSDYLKLEQLDSQPEYPGGFEAMYQFLRATIIFPKMARENHIQGKVYVSFIVDVDGSIKEPRVLEDVGGGCGQEALRVIKLMPKWKPGIKSGKPVRVLLNIPIVFTIESDDEIKQSKGKNTSSSSVTTPSTISNNSATSSKTSSGIFYVDAPSGQRLWFKTTSDKSNDVILVFPGDDYNNPYKGFTKPCGCLLIPEKVTQNGITYNVTSIGGYAFFGCKDLEDIIIPNSIKKIYQKAFAECINAIITLQGSEKLCASDSFEGCRKIIGKNKMNRNEANSNGSSNQSHKSISHHTKIYNLEKEIRKDIGKQNDDIVGIYRNISTGTELAVVKQLNDYIIVFVDGEMEDVAWTCGDLKAKLTSSASFGLFQAEWYMPDYSLNSKCLVLFDGITMKVMTDNDEQVLLKMYPSAVTGGGIVSETMWSGSGFALYDGYVITNHHVIENARTITIKGVKGDFNRAYSAQVITVDKINDIAILKIKDDNFKGFGVIPYGITSRIADVGEDVFVLGWPLGHLLGEEIKMTTGSINSRTGFGDFQNCYQIQAPITGGNSGGPVFDSKGNVIGIVVGGLNKELNMAENVGYAIKTSYLKILIENAGLNISFPNNNRMASLSRPEKIKRVKNFVYYIECSK